MALWVFDWETMYNLAEVSFLSYEGERCETFVIDDDVGRNDRKKLIEFVKGQTFVGYNNKTFDDIITNFVIRHEDVTALELHKLAQRIIGGQKDENFNIYREFGVYMQCEGYTTIDLIRLLFSKKLRVGLKELECSLNHDNVEELPFSYDKVLTQSEKEQVISYNINDCRATKLVLQKSIEALQLRRWMQKEYGIDAFSMDGVNGGVKILEVLYEKLSGNDTFKKKGTWREFIHIRDIILPLVEFETKEFKDVLEVYRKHVWYSSHYDEELFEDSKLKYEPLINKFRFKFSLGGLHGFTQPGLWESTDEYEIISVDVNAYYPSLLIKYRFCPAHLNTNMFLKVYGGVKDERMAAKTSGDKMKNETLKLSINGAYGMFGNQYNWLFDHKVRLQICVNGQLFLAMLIEKFFLEGIQLIDANTDGVYMYVHKSKKERFLEIIKEWEKKTKMEMEQIRFEKLWILNSSDYFGTYISKGKIAVKEKGMFQSTVQLGKGMSFPIVAKAVKEYFINDTPFEEYIKKSDNVLDFLSYKKLNQDVECWHNNQKVQRTNRYYASKEGAYLFRKSFKESKTVDVPNMFGGFDEVDTKESSVTHLLKDSPVIILNKLDNKPINERGISYGFYTSAARTIIHAIEGDRTQKSLF